MLLLLVPLQESDTTRQVYDSTVQDLVSGTLHGYNGTVFAYGQTGSGKTHTIIGKRSDPGVLMMGVEELFEGVAKVGFAAYSWIVGRSFPPNMASVCHSKSFQAKREDGGSYVLRVGILEIYNEEMRDLGAPSQAQRLHQGESNRLQIKEDPVQGIKVRGVFLHLLCCGSSTADHFRMHFLICCISGHGPSGGGSARGGRGQCRPCESLAG